MKRGVVIHRSEDNAPNTVYELKECIKHNKCRIGKDYTQTHVTSILYLSFSLALCVNELV